MHKYKVIAGICLLSLAVFSVANIIHGEVLHQECLERFGNTTIQFPVCLTGYKSTENLILLFTSAIVGTWLLVFGLKSISVISLRKST